MLKCGENLRKVWRKKTTNSKKKKEYMNGKKIEKKIPLHSKIFEVKSKMPTDIQTHTVKKIPTQPW